MHFSLSNIYLGFLTFFPTPFTPPHTNLVFCFFKSFLFICFLFPYISISISYYLSSSTILSFFVFFYLFILHIIFVSILLCFLFSSEYFIFTFYFYLFSSCFPQLGTSFTVVHLFSSFLHFLSILSRDWFILDSEQLFWMKNYY
jgi:hypothetical protein